MADTFKLELTTPELLYFGSALALPNLAIDKDWGSVDESEWEKLILAAQDSLEDKNYIRVPSDEGGTLALDQTVVAMVSALAYPQHELEVQTFRERQVRPERAHLFSLGELIVEQTQDGPGANVLTACRTRDVALARVVDFLGLERQPAAHTESFYIAAPDMAQVAYVIAGNGYEAGAAFLREAGAPATAASRLAAALENPVRQSMIRAAGRMGDEMQEVGRLTILEEVYGLWLIAPAGAGDGPLAVTPVTATEAIDRVRELVYQVIP